MSEDLDVEVLPEEADEPAHRYYLDECAPDERRRYIALDMARMIGPLPDKTLKLAREIEAFLLGRGPKAVE